MGRDGVYLTDTPGDGGLDTGEGTGDKAWAGIGNSHISIRQRVHTDIWVQRYNKYLR